MLFCLICEFHEFQLISDIFSLFLPRVFIYLRDTNEYDKDKRSIMLHLIKRDRYVCKLQLNELCKLPVTSLKIWFAKCFVTKNVDVSEFVFFLKKKVDSWFNIIRNNDHLIVNYWYWRCLIILSTIFLAKRKFSSFFTNMRLWEIRLPIWKLILLVFYIIFTWF